MTQPWKVIQELEADNSRLKKEARDEQMTRTAWREQERIKRKEERGGGWSGGGWSGGGWKGGR